MKFHLLAAVLSCVLLLSSAFANVTDTEQSLTQLEEVPQNADKTVPVAEEPLVVALPEVQNVLVDIPELVQKPTEGQVNDETIQEIDNNTEAIAIPQETSTTNNREPKQLIGFIPTYVLRQAIRMAQEQEVNDVRALRFYNDEDDASNEIEEERAIRRRKRFRRRNSKGHLKKSRRHRNSNKRKLKKHRKVNTKRKTLNRRGTIQRRKSPKKTYNMKRKLSNPRRDN